MRARVAATDLNSDVGRHDAGGVARFADDLFEAPIRAHEEVAEIASVPVVDRNASMRIIGTCIRGGGAPQDALRAEFRG
jgi:hypothetical protein